MLNGFVRTAEQYRFSWEKYMFRNLLKSSRFSSKPTEHDLLAVMPATIGKLKGVELGIPTDREIRISSRTKIIEIAKQDPLKTSALIHTWLRDRS